MQPPAGRVTPNEYRILRNVPDPDRPEAVGLWLVCPTPSTRGRRVMACLPDPFDQRPSGYGKLCPTPSTRGRRVMAYCLARPLRLEVVGLWPLVFARPLRLEVVGLWLICPTPSTRGRRVMALFARPLRPEAVGLWQVMCPTPSTRGRRVMAGVSKCPCTPEACPEAGQALYYKYIGYTVLHVYRIYCR
jgi:hypothetical protein